MQQSCPRRLRHGAAIGAAVAVVTASSAFGIGATAAFADDAPTAVQTVDSGTPVTSDAAADTRPGGTTSDPTTAPAGDTVAPDRTTTPDETHGTAAAPAVPDAPAAPAVTPAAEQRAGLAFPDGTTADAPLLLEATAGDTVDRTFTAAGGTAAVTYELRGAGGKPIVGDGSFNDDYTLDGSTGRLSGTARLATSYDFQVVATSGSERAVEYVRLTVRPGAPVGVTFAVSASDGAGMWQVETDGTIWEQAAGQGRVRIVPEVPVAEGSPLVLAGLAVDAYGNRTTPGGDDDPHPRSTVTSTVPSDRAVWSDDGSNTVSFTATGTRTLTVSEGGASTSFTVDASSATESFGFAAETQTRFTAVAGEPFSAEFPVTGGGDDLRYQLRSSDGTPYEGQDGLDVRIDPRTGSLTGSGTVAGTYHLRVVAAGGGVEAVVPVELTVTPAAFDHFDVSVRQADAGDTGDWWYVEGDTVEHVHGDPVGERVDAVPARQGDRMVVFTVAQDRFGNVLDHLVDRTLTSDVASDRFALDPVSGGTTVTFARASRHVVTVSYEGGSQAIPIDVSPDAEASIGHDATGTLAYTGSDSSGPLGWALGLLAAGGGLLLHRLRRRRA
ncbi:hypothetical protein [Curtobacterium sp. 458]|uniref:hypothetical protein n=1 Tax=Curtobacterium sp. 458 TaxID=3050069 RepID=UPI0025B2FD5D|nr:hypothetical protein [Curtobacterium sp. 458]WJX99823.1 hypothetical protein QPJ90_16195 [Curtobacterium sp. 458]